MTASDQSIQIRLLVFVRVRTFSAFRVDGCRLVVREWRGACDRKGKCITSGAKCAFHSRDQHYTFAA